MKHIQSTTQKHEAGLVVGSFQHMNPVVMQCNLRQHNSTSVLEFQMDVQMVYIFPSGTFASSVATASPKEGNQPQNNLPNQLDDPLSFVN